MLDKAQDIVNTTGTKTGTEGAVPRALVISSCKTCLLTHPRFSLHSRFAPNAVGHTMDKQADEVAGEASGGIESLLGKYLSNLGSVRGAAPRVFKSHGGPLVGSAIQSILLGGLGYGAGSLLAPLYTDDPKSRKRIRRTMAALGALGGPLGNPALGYNVGSMAREPGKAWQYGLLKSLNLPATMKGPFADRPVNSFGGYKKSGQWSNKGADPTGGMLGDEEFNIYALPSFHNSSIAVGQMSDMVRRSGLHSDAANPLIATMQEAAGGSRGLISPANIMSAGMKLGVGYLIGKPAMRLVSKTLGAVAGTSIATQQKLTNYGTLGIMLYNAFGGRR